MFLFVEIKLIVGSRKSEIAQVNWNHAYLSKVGKDFHE